MPASGAPVLWCAECLKQRHAAAAQQLERVQLQHELIHTAIDTWKDDPELLWVSLGTRLLRWHLEKDGISKNSRRTLGPINQDALTVERCRRGRRSFTRRPYVARA
jgi:hypothetical protein